MISGDRSEAPWAPFAEPNAGTVSPAQDGAEDFAVNRGFISIAGKQGWNLIQALMHDPETLIARLRTM